MTTYGVDRTGEESYGGSMGAAATDDFPIELVEWSPTTNPTTGAPVWVAFPRDQVRSVTWNRGRSRDLGRYGAGSAAVVVSNAGRTYDPEYAAGPFFGQLRPNREIRIRSVYAGVTQDEFYGYINGFYQSYVNPNDSICTITATDGFKVLAGKKLPASVYAAEVLADAPTHWWRLGDPTAATSLADNVALVSGTPVGAVAMGTAGLIVRDSDTAVTLSAGTGEIQFPASVALPAGAWTVEFWVGGLASSGSEQILLAPSAAGSNADPILSVYPTGVLNLDQPGASPQLGTHSVVGGTHHIALVRDGASGIVTVYLDGAVEITPPAGSASLLAGTSELWISRGVIANIGGTIRANGTFDEYALYNTALSAARVAAHNSAGRTPWNGDLPGARIGRILDIAAWPAAKRDVDAGTTALQSTTLGSTTVLDYCQQVEETEAGQFFMGKNGNARFVGRQEGSGPAYRVSAATLGDSAGEIGYVELGYDYEDQPIINEARVSRDGGLVAIVSNAASAAEFFGRTEIHDGLLHSSDQHSLFYAQHIVALKKNPVTRATTVKLLPQGNAAAAWPAILALELGMRVTLKRRPQGVGTVISQEMMVEGISVSARPKAWSVNLQLSPFAATKYWRLGITGYSELGTSTRLGF